MNQDEQAQNTTGESPDTNPYAAPDSEIAINPDIDSSNQLADRGTRLVAAILDGVIVLIPYFLIAFLLGILDFNDPVPSVGNTLILTVIYIALWIAINFNPLKQGQTVGKKIMKIRMVDYNDGSVPSMARLIGARYVSIVVISQVLTLVLPIASSIFALVDALMIFGNERRCLHDHFAKTKVVKVPST